MKQVYCDNGSTSFPKAPGLGKAVGRHIDSNGYNISRGGYEKAYRLETDIIETREKICRLLSCKNPKNVIFTPGATIGLNMILKGLLHKGDHVVTTSMEHNAVVRPIVQLEKLGVSWSEAQCDKKGILNPECIKNLIRPETKLVLSIHGSNVSGSILPVENIGAICREKNIFFWIDASQTAGGAEVDFDQFCADAIVFPGHKALMGPQGIGGIIISDEMANMTETLLSGGTGSISDKETMPEFLPDKFQPGTLNIPGIIGLKHSISFIEQEGLEGIIQHKNHITDAFIENICNMKGVELVGPGSDYERCSVVSLDFSGMDNAEAAFTLENEYGIMTRCGLHCAPHAHKTLGTFPQGTVRFSFGYFNTMEDICYVTDSIRKIL